MKIISLTATSVWLFLLLPFLSYGQQAEAPVYKDGDWWRIKYEYSLKEGYDRSPGCYDEYSEYFVEIKQGKPSVYGVTGTKKEAIDCSQITELLLNIPDRRMFLKFPLTVNKTWSHRFQNPMDKWRYSDTNVESWEKVRTPKAEFDAFKIKWVRSTRRGDIELRINNGYIHHQGHGKSEA